MERDFIGKVAVVTGAASGIGQATALLYASHGAKVVVSDIHQHAGNGVVKQIREIGAEAIFIEADVSKPEQCEVLMRNTIEAF